MVWALFQTDVVLTAAARSSQPAFKGFRETF